MPSLRTARADATREVVVDIAGDEKFRILRPTISALGEAGLLFAEGLTVSFGGVLLVWGTVADMAVQDNKSGPSLRLAENFEGVLDAINVICVPDSQDVPSICKKSGGNVFRESDIRVPLNADVVVVVNPTEVIKPQMPRKGCGFRGNSLHHATISANYVDVVIEDFEAATVVVAGKPFLADGHSYAGGHALSERPGCGFNS